MPQLGASSKVSLLVRFTVTCTPCSMCIPNTSEFLIPIGRVACRHNIAPPFIIELRREARAHVIHIVGLVGAVGAFVSRSKPVPLGWTQ